MKHSHAELGRDALAAKYDKQPFDKVWKLIKPYHKLLFGSVFSLIVMDCLGLTMPWMLKIGIDRVLPNADYLLFWVLAIGMIIIYSMRCLVRYIACYLVDYTGVRVMIDLRQKIFTHLQSLSLRFYQEYRTGKLISNIINDVSLLQMLMRVMNNVGEQFFQLCLIMFILMMINWKLGLIVLITIPLHNLNFNFFRKKMRSDSMVLQEKMSEISANISETLTGVKIVKSFARERRESLDFFQSMRPIVDMQMNITIESVGLWAIFDIISIITYLSLIGVGVWFVQDGSITIGEFVAFYTYTGMLLGLVNFLSGMSMTFAQGMVGASRIVNILNTIPEIKEAPHPIHVKRMNGNIEFRDVYFSYDKDKQPTIENFNLKIDAGHKVALVGASGSGKSTISNLLLRFYDVDSGNICVDKYDIRKLCIEEYRNNIGVVLQEPFLFSGSIRDNIAYAVKRPVTDEEIAEAARMANAEDFIQELPEGYDTVIGENGASLSGGQKQRIAIARAVLKNPSILILDEATSALDTVSEYLVQDALDKLMKGKTTIIIAHRLSTIKNADTIIVLDHGRIVQKGSHDELIAQKGTYSELYQSQSRINEVAK